MSSGLVGVIKVGDREMRVSLDDLIKMLKAWELPEMDRLAEEIVVELYRQGEISLSYGAQLLGITINQFLDILRKYGVKPKLKT